MFTTPDRYIVPFLPPLAIGDIEEWRASGRIAFQRVLPMDKLAKCKNCQDVRGVYVSFCRDGPYGSPPGHAVGEVLTWFEGDGQTGKGWYIVASMKTKQGNRTARTIAYPCPACAPQEPVPAPSQWWEDQ